jgi:uncharacterized protein DUF4328
VHTRPLVRFLDRSSGYTAAMPASYEPLESRQQGVTIVFAIIVAVSIGAIVCDVFELRMLDRLIAGEELSDADWSANDTRQGIAGLSQLGALVAGAVVFIRWLHGAYKNLEVVAPQERRYGHGWAIGGWFVPVMNLWRPKQVVNDVWRGTGRDPVSPLLWFWWMTFIVSGWVGSAAVDSIFEDQTPEELRSGTIGYLVSDTLDIVCAILAIAIVRIASDGLDQRAAAIPPAPPGEGWETPERPVGLPA